MITLLVNPRSNAVAALRVFDYLRGRGAAVELIAGRDEAEALALAHRAVTTGTGALIACGGDGLVNIALQAVARTGTPLGVIPIGTGNDHARMLGIPLRDPIAAARITLDGRMRTIDLGRADGRWFGTVFAGGFDAKVSDRANRLAWPRGRLRYNLAVLAELSVLRPLDYLLDLDGRVLVTRATLVAIGNGACYGGGMRVCPSATPDDGLFDVTVVGPVGRSRLVRLLPTIYPGTHIGYAQVSTYRARRVRVSTPDLVGYADGEPFARLPVTCECVPGAARVLVP